MYVESAAKAAGRAQTRGAAILHGPAEVPCGSWIVQACDPQGERAQVRHVTPVA
jgi:predicted enzyme related to lactoylglutathione lyase